MVTCQAVTMTGVTTTITDMLHRRSDLSTFLVHYTKVTADDATGFEALKSIVTDTTIEARTAYGAAAQSADPAIRNTQKVVCFTETPLEHSWTMTRELAERRAFKFAPYGVVFTKTYARRNRCNPVWYVNCTPGYTWPMKAINAAVQAETRPFSDEESILRVAPYIEQMGDWSTGSYTNRKEFWWEREWRRVGDFWFQPNHTVALLAPERDHQELNQTLVDAGQWSSRDVPILDPNWGLERMMVCMSGVAREDIGPFP